MAKRRLNIDNLSNFSESIQNLKTVGPLLQKRRKDMGYTQESFAEELDISPNTVKYIEQGRRAPSLAMLLKIARLLKVQLRLESK